MDPVKPGVTTSEFIALAASVVVAVVPILLDKIPKESTLYVVLGVLMTVATYIVGRTALKVSAVKGQALVDASENVQIPPKS